MWLNIFGSSSQPSYILFIYFSIYSFICFVHVIYAYVWVYEGWKYINAGVLHVYRSEVVLCYSSPYFYHLTYTEKEQLEKIVLDFTSMSTSPSLPPCPSSLTKTQRDTWETASGSLTEPRWSSQAALSMNFMDWTGNVLTSARAADVGAVLDSTHVLGIGTQFFMLVR